MHHDTGYILVQALRKQVMELRKQRDQTQRACNIELTARREAQDRAAAAERIVKSLADRPDLILDVKSHRKQHGKHVAIYPRSITAKDDGMHEAMASVRSALKDLLVSWERGGTVEFNRSLGAAIWELMSLGSLCGVPMESSWAAAMERSGEKDEEG
jgi:hypothetical protein